MRESASVSFTTATGFFLVQREIKNQNTGDFDTVFLFLIRHLVLPNGGCKLKHGVPSVSLLPV
jgi:hypothetical protein